MALKRNCVTVRRDFDKQSAGRLSVFTSALLSKEDEAKRARS